MKRTEKEMLMKRVGRWLGIGYRFHRRPRLQVTPDGKDLVCIVSRTHIRNPPRNWGFEFWKKIPGNPLNRYSDPAGRSEPEYVDIPKEFREKDDIIDWLLTKSGFIKRAGGPDIGSYEELNMHLETAAMPEKI